MSSLKCVLASCALVFATSAFAAPEVATPPEAPDQIPLQEKLVGQIDAKISEFKQRLRERTLSFHKLQQVPEQGPLYVWQKNDSAASQRRDMAMRMVSLSLKESLKELDILENRRLEAQAELEWLKIQQEEVRGSSAPVESALAETRVFRCRVLPLVVEHKAEVLQDFGSQKDADTGLVWNSLGWWISAINSEVRACDSGRVVFVGDISGRGRVVMLDHGAGHLTVYANLELGAARHLSRGARVESGAALGRTLDRLYFEFRSKGVAADPRQALRPELLEHVTL